MYSTDKYIGFSSTSNIHWLLRKVLIFPMATVSNETPYLRLLYAHQT